MWKRVLSAGMWFVLIAWAWNYAAWLLDAPEALGPMIGAAVALFVAVDPLRLFWPRPAESTPKAVAPAFVGELRPVE